MDVLKRSAIACAIALLAAACGSTSVSTVAPTTPKCTVTATTSAPSASASGGSGTITVEATRDCTWSASSTAAWIAVPSGASGQGEGTVPYAVAANPDHAQRHGAVNVNDVAVAIAQDAAACVFTLDSTSVSLGAAGGPATVLVTAVNGCGWTATSNAGWISVASGATSTGSGTVSLRAGANTGEGRSGTVTIAGQTFTIYEAGATPQPSPTPAPTPAPSPSPAPAPTPTCTYSISPTSDRFGSAGGTVAIAVTAAAGCRWTATSNVSWATITQGSSGSGNGTVGFTIAVNAGALRTGTMTVAGQTFNLTQEALAPPPPACTYSIDPTSRSFSTKGGSVTVSVATDASCAWTATSNAIWITIQSGAAGMGAGSVSVAVASDSGASRTGTATIAGQTFTVTQEGK